MLYAAATVTKLLVTLITIKTVASTILWDTDCGATKGCFPDCRGGCEYLVTWRDTGSNIMFTLKAEEKDTMAYLAVGFSDDYRMGDDSVVGCSIPGSTVYSYHNDGTDSNELSPSKLGLSLPSLSHNNGVITCNFTRSYDEADDKFFNLHNDYILMLVVGEVEEKHGSHKMEHHYKIPWSSDSKVDFNSHYVVGLYKLNSPAVKLHGIMMVLAWLLLVIVGIVTARYNKDMLPEHKLFGTKVWFQVHRAAMVTALVFVVIGFILIFIHIGGYSQIVSPPSQEAVQAHPVLGIIIVVLCFTNPIMAMFRPGGDHKFRWIFNWAHLGVGVVALLLAIVNIILGLFLERVMVSNSAIYITIVHLIVVAIISIALEVNKWKTAKNKKGEEIDGTSQVLAAHMETAEKDYSKPWSLPFILLMVLCGLLLVFSIAFLTLIATS